jgi:hypothetical protein
MSERPLFSRRDFLETFAFSGGVVLMTRLMPKEVSDLLIRERKKDYKQRNGVYISGEDEPISYRGGQYLPKVNELYFLQALKAMAKVKGKESELENHLITYPLRICIKDMIFADASYADSSKTFEPTISISNELLEEYLSAEITGRQDLKDKSDTKVIHEMIHLYQDATSDILQISYAIDAAAISLSGIGSTKLIYNAGNRIIDNIGGERSEELREEAKGVSLLIGTAQASVVYGLMNLLSPAEMQAYKQAPQIVKWKEIEPFKGGFFNFEQV